MPVTLRQPANPTRDVVVLSAIAQVALGSPTPNVNLANQQPNPATGLGPLYIQREYDMLNAGIFPAALVMAGQQDYFRNSNVSYDGKMQVRFDYYDDWTQRPDKYDDIRADIALDLERIVGNLLENEQLAVAGVSLALSLHHYKLSPYAGIDRDYNSLTLVYRSLFLDYTILDFDA